MATSAPCFTKSYATALPIPLSPPVISAALPSSFRQPFPHSDVGCGYYTLKTRLTVLALGRKCNGYLPAVREIPIVVVMFHGMTPPSPSYGERPFWLLVFGRFHTVQREFIQPQSFEHRLTHPAAFGPVHKCNHADQLRFQPHGIFFAVTG